jgi:hypothetical protein
VAIVLPRAREPQQDTGVYLDHAGSKPRTARYGAVFGVVTEAASVRVGSVP